MTDELAPPAEAHFGAQVDLARGLTVRWSLVGTQPEVTERLRTYVSNNSFATFSGMAGLEHKTWRLSPGEWFEGVYVFHTVDARVGFQARFTEQAADAPPSTITGAPPVLIEPCEVMAVAAGSAGFSTANP